MTRPRKASRHAPDAIRLMVVESRTLLGIGVRDILDREADIDVVAQVGTPAEAIPVVSEAAPDIIWSTSVRLPRRPASPACSGARCRTRHWS